MKFLDSIYRYWKAPFIGTDLYRDSKLSVVINPWLDVDEKVTILHTLGDAHTAIALRPEVEESLNAIGLWDTVGSEAVMREDLRQIGIVIREGLRQIGIVMHGADNLFYLPESARLAWLAEADADCVRRLHAGDEAILSEFERRASQEDLDAALVDLNDWAVFGAIDQDGRLLSIASIYPWGDVPLADIGVLTLEVARGNGRVTQLLRAAARHAMARGYELQYRCQLDNKASVALAQAGGLALFGRWEIPAPDSTVGLERAAPLSMWTSI